MDLKRPRTAGNTTSRKRTRLNDGDTDKTNTSDSNSQSNGDISNDESHSIHKPTSRQKKDRKKNRSSRIHSLKKLIAHGTLPRTIHQEKERELAALLNDQETEKLKQQRKKNLSRYHYVRFVERQKAEKRLKQLRKEQDAGTTSLEHAIHEMEVNLNYAIYAPLGEKYVSVFAETRPQAQKNESRKRIRPRSKHEDIEVLEKRPPMWYEIEKALEQGKSKLEAIRDGKLQSMATDIKSTRSTRASMQNSGQENNKQRSRHPITTRDDQVNDDNEPDEDMSDGEFFER